VLSILLKLNHKKKMENESNQSLAVLFGRLEITDEQHLDTILQTMDKSIALVLLIHAVKHAFERGVYNIGETEVLSKCIRILSKES
jgi:hypothetical protein